MVRYVYADVLFLINAAMNFLLLWVTARLMRHLWKPARGALASLLGALYSVGLLVPGLSAMYSSAGKVVFSLFMLAIAFPGVGFRNWCRSAACFFCLTWVTAGAAFALHFLGSGALGLSRPVSWWTLGVAVLAMALPARVVWGLSQGYQWQRAQCFSARVEMGDASVDVMALLDTGNRLTDPLTGLPVMVVEHDAVRELLPQQVRSASAEDLLEMVGHEFPGQLGTRLRLIPYRGIGNDGGLLVGFRPDRVLIQSPAAPVNCRNVVVALYERALCPDGLYRALVPPQMLDTG
ncbi:MAG: sigma-E processing peptidase SpoIIGA [Bacillota bacterium]